MVIGNMILLSYTSNIYYRYSFKREKQLFENLNLYWLLFPF